MKLEGGTPTVVEAMSRPVRGAWIETQASYVSMSVSYRRAPCGARGLKRATKTRDIPIRLSRPVRGAWIETIIPWYFAAIAMVAPRAGRVD